MGVAMCHGYIEEDEKHTSMINQPCRKFGKPVGSSLRDLLLTRDEDETQDLMVSLGNL